MAIDKKYCMSSFLAFRYIYDKGKEFAEGIRHRAYNMHSEKEKTLVNSAKEIDIYLESFFSKIKNKKIGILLSGGMDSAILASYMRGCNAYTFRFLNGNYQSQELKRAELYAQIYNLKLHYVDISWDSVEETVDIVMAHKGAPVHSIEPQIFVASKQAKNDGIEIMIIGDAADYVFYGMDGLLTKDWDYESFYRRYIYIDPLSVLNNGVDMHFMFEQYKRPKNKIDFLGIYDQMFPEESYASYDNAFGSAELKYLDPYELMKMKEAVDLNRIRSGESKYLIRELFKIKYPNLDVPEKNPMPRPVDEYFKNWNGPSRQEFRKDIDIKNYSGNQKWLMWILERFLNNLDKNEDN